MTWTVLLGLAITTAVLSACGDQDPQTIDGSAPQSQELGKADHSVAVCPSPAANYCLDACGYDRLKVQPQCIDGNWTCEDGVPDNSCPDFLGACHAQSPCGDGYTCVKNLNYPVPADYGVCRKGVVQRNSTLESCAELGTTSTTQLLAQRDNFTGKLVKFAARIGVTTQCSKESCFADDPCCQTCVANYVAELADPLDPTNQMNILIRTEALACLGTNCGIGCTPLVVGETYKLWGLLEECQGHSKCTLLYMGGCIH